jgi:hypothetical protein
MLLAYPVTRLYRLSQFKVQGEDFVMGAGHSAFRGSVVNSNRLVVKGGHARDGIRFPDDCYEGDTNAAFVYAIVAFSVLVVSVLLMVVNL